MYYIIVIIRNPQNPILIIQAPPTNRSVLHGLVEALCVLSSAAARSMFEKLQVRAQSARSVFWESGGERKAQNRV